MKRVSSSLFGVLLVAFAAVFFGCGENTTTYAQYDQAVKIETRTDGKTTLKEYMDSLVSVGELQYTEANGMITSINGVFNTDEYWMLYTDDMENANTAYGVQYEGETYYSSKLGAESLTVKDGYTYVWVYQEF